VLFEETRPLSLDVRLLLRALSISAEGSAQPMWPRFSAANRSYVAAVLHDLSRVTIDAKRARLSESAVRYRGADGEPLADADLEAAGLQLDLPASGTEQVEISVTHGARTRSYRVILVKTGPPDGVPPCANQGANQPQPASQPFEFEDDRLVVQSTPEHYYVLYAAPGAAGPELPISIGIGRGRSTTFSRPTSESMAERYRVERYRRDDPADIDGDCIDDLTELLDPAELNPLNPSPPIARGDGVAAVPDQAVFDELSYRKDGSPDDFAYLKFVLLDLETERPRLYLLNSRRHRYHVSFHEAVGLEPSGAGMLAGKIVQHAGRVARDGQPADYHFEFWPYTQYRFEIVARAWTALAASLPLLEGRLAYYVPVVARQAQAGEAERHRAASVPVVFDENIRPERGFIALNPAVGNGRLRLMMPGERPGPRDVVIYEAIPNELPRVAGIITTAAQTPLSHVNLRAVQDGVPNAYIMGALESTEIAGYVGKQVRYEVGADGWRMREVSAAEVEAFYASSRPRSTQTPERDLSVRRIRSLGEIGFEDWRAFGLKAANLAVLGRLRLPSTAPDGYAVPFFFYNEFMRQNDLYRLIEEMLTAQDFQSDPDVQLDELRQLRKLIRDATMPRWMLDELELPASVVP